ncbi:MAG: hypothetical protein WC712_02040 [Candidatus Brocadiia bacterium]
MAFGLFRKDKKDNKPSEQPQPEPSAQLTGFGASAYPQEGYNPYSGLETVSGKRRLNTAPVRIAKRIGDLFYATGKVAEDDLREALRLAELEGMLLGRALVSMGRMKEGEVLHCLEQQKLVTSVDIGRLKIPQDVINLVPETIVHRFNVVPFDLIGEHLSVCAKSPLSFDCAKTIRDRTRLRVRVFDSLEGWNALRDCIEFYYPVAK